MTVSPRETAPEIITEVPVISFIGWSGSGKTTFLEKVIAELTAEGISVGTIKHHGHDTDIDVPGKDSWRHARAGASPVIVSSPTQYSLIRKVERERTLAELATEAAPYCDVLLTEGYREQASFVIEFSRKGHNDTLISNPALLRALISDNPELRAIATDAALPVFDLDDVKKVTEFIRLTCRLDAADTAPAAHHREG